MITSNKNNWRSATLLVAGSFLVAHLCFFLLPSVFDTWNLQATDRFYRFRSGRSLHPDIVCVAVDQESYTRLGSLYLQRSWCTRVVRALGKVNASVQAWDVVFGARFVQTEDEELTAATAGAENVVFSMMFQVPEGLSETRFEGSPPPEPIPGQEEWILEVEGDAERFFDTEEPLPNMEQLVRAAAGLGHINQDPDRDGTIRRVALLLQHRNGFLPNLALITACKHLGVTPDRITVRPGRSLTLGQARIGDASPRDIVIPIDAHGRMIIDYVLPWETVDPRSFYEVHADVHDYPDVWRDTFEGKIVLIGDTSQASRDIGSVPTVDRYPLVGTHVSVVNSILRSKFLRALTRTETILIELGIGLTLLLLSVFCRSLHFVVGCLLLAFLLVGGAGIGFVSLGIVTNSVRPLLAIVLAVVAVGSYRFFVEEKEKVKVRSTFEAYFPPQVVKKLMADSSRFTPTSHKKILTVLFSDIKNFTRMSDERDPIEIQESLNEYFGAMVEIIFRHGGTVDKFIGDGLMVFFGDPEPQEDHALRCVRAAIEMQRKVRELNGQWSRRGWMDLVIRVGAHTGPMVVGNMGSSRRLTYTVLGSAVNLASRLESNAPPGGILISRPTYELVKNDIPTEFCGDLEFKGFSEPIPAYLVPVDES